MSIFGSTTEAFSFSVQTSFDSERYLSQFGLRHARSFYHLDTRIGKSAVPTSPLVAGEAYRISFIPIIKKKNAHEKDTVKGSICVQHLLQTESLFLGVQGLAYLWEFHREALKEVTQWIISLDTEDHLIKDEEGLLRVGSIKVLKDDRWLFGLADYCGGFCSTELLLHTKMI